MNRSEYIEKYKRAAINSTRWSGLFPSVLLAQGILESNNGNSSLTSLYNNHFGIKSSKDWSGDSVNLKTGEVIDNKDVVITDSFRVYKTPKQSFNDRNSFLKKYSRYENVFNANTPEEQAKEIHKAGYATARNYSDTLISIINDNNLKKYDKIQKRENILIVFSLFFVIFMCFYFILKSGVLKNFIK